MQDFYVSDDGCCSLPKGDPLGKIFRSLNREIGQKPEFIYTVICSSGLKRVPLRYHFSVPSVPERPFPLPAVLQNHRVRPTQLAYEARGQVFESPRAYHIPKCIQQFRKREHLPPMIGAPALLAALSHAVPKIAICPIVIPTGNSAGKARRRELHARTKTGPSGLHLRLGYLSNPKVPVPHPVIVILQHQGTVYCGLRWCPVGPRMATLSCTSTPFWITVTRARRT